MTHLADESDCDIPRLDFERRVDLEFHRCAVTSDAGSWGQLIGIIVVGSFICFLVSGCFGSEHPDISRYEYLYVEGSF